MISITTEKGTDQGLLSTEDKKPSASNENYWQEAFFSKEFLILS